MPTISEAESNIKEVRQHIDAWKKAVLVYNPEAKVKAKAKASPGVVKIEA